MYHACDFSRVPVDYWGNIERVKERFEWKLRQEGLTFADIPSVINYNTLIKWGFSNPLKRYGHSPFRLVEAMYPNLFKETDFKKVPHHYSKDNTALKKQFLNMLEKEQISLEDVPYKVNRDMLVTYRFSSVLSSYSNSVSKFITSLFPDDFSIENFSMRPNGYWQNLSNTREAIQQLLKDDRKTEKDIPMFLTKRGCKMLILAGFLIIFMVRQLRLSTLCIQGNLTLRNFNVYRTSIGIQKRIEFKHYGPIVKREIFIVMFYQL